MVEKKVNNKGDDTLYGVLSGRHICLFYAARKDLIDLDYLEMCLLTKILLLSA